MSQNYGNPIFVLDAVLGYFAMCYIKSDTPYSKEELLPIKVDNTEQMNDAYAILIRVKKIKDRDEPNDMPLLIQSLIDDKYLTIIKDISDKNDKGFYQITFDGLMFHQSGGYTKRIEDNKAAINYAKTIDDKVEVNRNTQTDLQKQMNSLTFFVSIGTLIAACYYLQEILTFCFGDKFCWGYCIIYIPFLLVLVFLTLQYLDLVPPWMQRIKKHFSSQKKKE